MTRTRRALVAAAVVAGLVLLAVPYLRAARTPSGGTGSQRGQQAPLFDSTDFNGQPIALGSYLGHRVILNFWASWCTPCRAEFPVLKQLLGRHPDVVVLGVDFQDIEGSARSFMASKGAGWPGVRDPKSQIADAYDVHSKPGIPVSILIDARGRVVARQYGGLLDQAAADAFVNLAPAAG